MNIFFKPTFFKILVVMLSMGTVEASDSESGCCCRSRRSEPKLTHDFLRIRLENYGRVMRYNPYYNIVGGGGILKDAAAVKDVCIFNNPSIAFLYHEHNGKLKDKVLRALSQKGLADIHVVLDGAIRLMNSHLKTAFKGLFTYESLLEPLKDSDEGDGTGSDA